MRPNNLHLSYRNISYDTLLYFFFYIFLYVKHGKSNVPSITAGENDTNQNSSKSMSRQKTLAGLNGYDLTGFSLASKLMIRSNSIGPEINDLLEDYKKESRPYVLNPKYTSPSSLPLYFYFGYQLLQETNEMKKSGPVSLRNIALVSNQRKNCKNDRFNVTYIITSV